MDAALQEVRHALLGLSPFERSTVAAWLRELELQDSPWRVAEKSTKYGVKPGIAVERPRLYLETTIPSYLTARPSRDLIRAGHQQITRDWWELRRERFDIWISDYVLKEVAAGDETAARSRLNFLSSLKVLDASEFSRKLSGQLLQEANLPPKAAVDASHIAIAAVHGMDYLLTWNCRHIANAEFTPKIRQVCEAVGLACPIICTPEELMGGYDDERVERSDR